MDHRIIGYHDEYRIILFSAGKLGKNGSGPDHGLETTSFEGSQLKSMAGSAA